MVVDDSVVVVAGVGPHLSAQPPQIIRRCLMRLAILSSNL